DFVPALTGQQDKGPRESFFYFSDEGDLVGLRYDNWKFAFAVQEAQGTLRVWMDEFKHPRIPFIFNLRTDPYERAPITSNTYYDWVMDHAFLLVPAQDYVGAFLMTLKDYPPRQKAASFNMDEVMNKLKQPGGAPD
ncbi:MAG TPA: arylsulfatase, partial [Rhodoblastus sp.]|nr:arylsulfatase [Rhodoblastus sp.]